MALDMPLDRHGRNRVLHSLDMQHHLQDLRASNGKADTPVRSVQRVRVAGGVVCAYIRVTGGVVCAYIRVAGGVVCAYIRVAGGVVCAYIGSKRGGDIQQRVNVGGAPQQVLWCD